MTVAEVLKQTGLTDEQIAALDAKAIAGFTAVLSSAEQKSTEASAAAARAEAERAAAVAAKEAAESTGRSNTEFYEQKIVPGLTAWEEEKKQLEIKAANEAAMAAFYKAQNEGARAAGFLPTDAPGYTPPAAPPVNNGGRDASGRYVAGQPGSTPGSPTFVNPTEVATKIGDIAGIISDIQWKHSTLYGKPLPIAPSELIRQADALKLDPLTYASRTFKFSEKEEIKQNAAKEHDAQIVAAALAKKEEENAAKIKAMQDEFAAKERKFAEGGGNNPDVHRAPGSSKFADVKRAVDTGARPNPLKMTDAERRASTRQAIHQEIAESAVA